MLDQAVKFLEHCPGKPDKSIDGIPVLPAALLLQRLRQLPVIERAEGLNAAIEQRCDEFFVILYPFRIHFTAASRINARPGDGEAVGFDAQLLHQPDILLIALIAVAGHTGIIAVINTAGNGGELVPYA
ncbi:hypothetical protein D3C75_1128270 [compost metagenome]